MDKGRNDVDAHFNQNLIDSGMMDPPRQNKVVSIASKIIYVLFSPKKFSYWLRTFFLDIKYGAYLGKRTSNGNYARGWWGSLNSNYDDLAEMFSQIAIRDNDIIVDVGCGKGRVFNFLLHRGYKNKLIGIEVDPVIAEATKKRLHKHPQIKIVIDAIENEGVLPLEGTIFYLANPFSELIVQNFADQLARKVKHGQYKILDRPLIVYYYCYYIDVFEANPLWDVKRLDTQFPAAIVYPRSEVAYT